MNPIGQTAVLTACATPDVLPRGNFVHKIVSTPDRFVRRVGASIAFAHHKTFVVFTVSKHFVLFTNLIRDDVHHGTVMLLELAM